MTFDELKSFLDEKSDLYNNPNFIESDPIQIPHAFSLKEDIEIAAFLCATIAWGNRKSVIANSRKMMALMGDSPYDFAMSHSERDLEKCDGFVHRTFNSVDLRTFLAGLRHIYQNHGGMEAIFTAHANDLQSGIVEFKKRFFEIPHQVRTQKHISDPLQGSAAKRIHMMLRWLVRQDNKGVDLGIWKGISPGSLSCPLDVHSGNIARKLGILSRKQNDAKAVLELDTKLRQFDANDPVKYDFALFGLGVFEGFANDGSEGKS
ncbi:TIGR02757 family protein [Flavobacterium selenitireducens]|uniref:TIGR02757 family protein n=1 Tax=Flavobacterium selenitireducens TaxID=2722704 RepID=UPI00168B0780|nr:TIGR02757 family protein [Flavobacterium selenitireducens]MBD3581498.1 TIGR02757 family protein [Flavobacterium selenitireducens]